MSTFKYGDEWIKTRDVFILVPSIMIAIGILNYTRVLAGVTEAADGWISIVLSGVPAIVLTWLVAKLATKYPHQSFLEYATYLVSKPVAVILTMLYGLLGIVLTAHEIRVIEVISEQYLFTRTPPEIITLTFLLVVVYAVSGSRVGIFRLNAMFLPITILSVIIVSLFSVGFMELKNVLPVFKTDVKGYMQGVMESTILFKGFGILFFYLAYVRKPERAPSMAAAGMIFVILIYVIIYLTCIAVFGQATEVIRVPLIELAKSIEIPGGFFERLESIFFTIWVMVIFIKAIIVLDVTVLALTLIFSKIDKMKWILGLTPVIYFISCIPRDYIEVEKLGVYISRFEIGFTLLVTILLWVMHLIKGGKKSAK